MDELQVDYRALAALKPHARNPRTHSKRQIRQIADSIKAFGFTNPILVDDAGGVLAGHGRIEAAKLLGIPVVPTIRLASMTEAQKRAYVIADNKLAENAGWDRELLAIELQYLVELDLEVDARVTGFETAEIDLLIAALDQEAPDGADQLIDVDRSEPAISRPGDLWAVGDHRLLCGDATMPAAFEQLLGGKRAQMVFVDAPYNVPIEGHVCGLGKVKHQEFAMAAGEMSVAEFVRFLNTVLGHLAAHSADGSIHFVCMDWRHIGEVLAAAKDVYSEFKNLVVWNKTNGGMGSLYRSKHELVFVFKAGTAPHINNVELGRHGRYRTNVWDYAGINTFSEGRQDALAMHPTVKPVALVADAIRDCSRHNGIVLDCFAGSGTTLVAAAKTGRRGYGIELDPHYVDVAIERLEGLPNLKAVHAETGRTFEEIKAIRAQEAIDVA
jgi:DNA modification methylase